MLKFKIRCNKENNRPICVHIWLIIFFSVPNNLEFTFLGGTYGI